jgi:hypothetical protein
VHRLSGVQVRSVPAPGSSNTTPVFLSRYSLTRVVGLQDSGSHSLLWSYSWWLGA